ncbi:MAG: hypothetical protein AAF593_04205 [Planctomycetota bacterium]
MSEQFSNGSRYAGLVKSLAIHAFEIVEDGSAHQPRPGETRFSLTQMLATAYTLISEDSYDPEVPPTDRDHTFVDGRGHSRPIYRHFAAYLYHRQTGAPPPAVRPDDHADDVSLRLWRLWHGVALGRGGFDAIDRLLGESSGPLHTQTTDDAPDHWTYRELVGLHALHALVELTDQRDDLPSQPGWRQRVIEITDYHQYRTQPDYTTYQPWGLAAFLSNPNTVMFAEQQLHDTQSHLQIEGGVGALLPALLLADAYRSLADAAQISEE